MSKMLKIPLFLWEDFDFDFTLAEALESISFLFSQLIKERKQHILFNWICWLNVSIKTLFIFHVSLSDHNPNYIISKLLLFQKIAPNVIPKDGCFLASWLCRLWSEGRKEERCLSPVHILTQSQYFLLF